MRALGVCCAIGLAACDVGQSATGGTPDAAVATADAVAVPEPDPSPEVPGGTYLRSFDVAGDAVSGTMSFPATVSRFRLDRYEITVARFRAFVNAGLGTQLHPPVAGSGAHPGLAASGWSDDWNANLAPSTAALIAGASCDPDLATWTDTPGAHEDRPMNCISWYDAMAFCIWDGGYLPTEAEWNFAAAGGNEQRAYPWSAPPGSVAIDTARVSFFDGTDCLGDGLTGCTATDLADVGSRPAGDGRWGHSDLAGNVMEWTLDFSGAYPVPCVDCANLTPSAHREKRGGSFGDGKNALRTGHRLGAGSAEERNGIVGARCARPAM